VVWVVISGLDVSVRRRRVVVRRFSDVVQVRPVEGAAGVARRPEAFIWRGRLYVVRDVLAQWRERRAWWREALDADGGGGPVVPGGSLAAAASEQQVWRVEASPGWSFAPGVYDLAHDEGAQGEQWQLVRVAD
jgi:hypothetical protein